MAIIAHLFEKASSYLHTTILQNQPTTEASKALQTLGHSKYLQFNEAPFHQALGSRRGKLANSRLGIEGQSKLSIIREGRNVGFFPVLNRLYEEAPTKVVCNREIRLLETLTNEEICDMMIGLEHLWESQDGSKLTLAEHRVVQDYIGREGFSRALNQFMRGENVQYNGVTREQFKEFGILMISA